MFRENYRNWIATIRVILNPTFQPTDSTTQTFQGCLTRPRVNQRLDPMMIRVDAGNATRVGDRENDNEFNF